MLNQTRLFEIHLMYKLLQSNKITMNVTNKSKEVSHFLADDHKAAMNRRESMRNTKHKKTEMIHKRNYALEWSVKICYWSA